MLARSLILATLTAALCGSASAQSLQESLDKAKRLTEEARRRDGFPPASDFAGTLLQCDRRIKAAQKSMLTCTGARAHRLVIGSSDPSDTLARAVVAGCVVERESLVRAAWPYCINERSVAEQAVSSFVRQTEDTALAIITEYRAKPPAPSPAPRAKPDTSL